MVDSLWRGLRTFWLLFLLLSTASTRLSAQDVAEPPEYRATIREALSEYHARNFPEARALFAQAHRLLPNARSLRGLGMTAFELRNYRESIMFLQEALASPVKPLEGGLRAETERLLKRAERFVGRLQLLLTPSDARILLDGSAVERVGSEPLILEIGVHSLEFQADGYAPETRTIDIHGRESESWTVALAKLPEPVVASPREVAEQAQGEPQQPSEAPPPPAPMARPLRKNPWLWGGVGAAALVGIVTGIVLATRDPGVGPFREGDNMPPGGVFEALESAP
jgi:hypothetical protein